LNRIFRSIAPLALMAAAAGAVVMTVASPALAQAAPAPAKADFSEMLEKGGQSLVTIKYILSDEGEEQENEVTGVLIAGDGLVLSSNFFFGGGPFGGGATPKDIKVLHGDDTVGVDAKFIARDTELGLAWIKVDKAPDKPFPFVDFSKHAEAKVGDELFTVRKMGKFFGQAFQIAEGRVAAAVTKPRNLLIPTIGLATRSELTLPLYNTSGEVIGVNTYILPDEEEMQGGAEAMKGAEYGMILPAKDVLEATAKALENAAKAPAEETKTEEAPQGEAMPEGQPK
jgi:S1-C subfamily serine protease